MRVSVCRSINHDVPYLLQSQMSMGVATTRSQRCLKRLLTEPQDNLPKCKKARPEPPPPSNGLSAYLRPTNPAPKSNQSRPPSRVGPYLLHESSEVEDTYRAVHASTQEQYTCQVSKINTLNVHTQTSKPAHGACASSWLQVLPLRGYQDRLAAYGRIGRHENICGLQDVVVTQDQVYVFLPSHHGDMHAYVRGRKRLDEEEAGRLFAQMLNAVAHCHRHGVILRDLKLRRFVFTDKYR